MKGPLRVCFVGPLTPDSLPVQVLLTFENPVSQSLVDITVIATTWRPPIPRWLSEHINRDAKAPFDIGVVVHDLDHAHMDENLFHPCRILAAYVTDQPEDLDSPYTIRSHRSSAASRVSTT